jgi:hypothetical protein
VLKVIKEPLEPKATKARLVPKGCQAILVTPV